VQAGAAAGPGRAGFIDGVGRIRVGSKLGNSERSTFGAETSRDP
jgi:hypothetical protein